MSNRQLKTIGVTFEPVRDELPPSPGAWIVALGVVYPAMVIVVEALTHICAQNFFDPLPTDWHVAAAAFVPASNLVIWLALEHGRLRHIQWLVFANGAAIAIATVYAALFLPLLPLAIVGILIGIGVLPLAPLASFVCTLKLRSALAHARRNTRLGWPLLGGIAAGVALLIVLDVVPALTRIGIEMAASPEPAERQRGLALLRAFGDDDLLLRLCYDSAGQPASLFSGFAVLAENNWSRPRRQATVSTAQAREVYYRLHGEPCNARPAPTAANASRTTATAFDSDHGGTQVGGRTPELSLASSRLDGSISADDLVSYLEWTLEFRNSGTIAREARLQFALPPGGVVSRATLWVNGEEREAAYGGRGEVRAAYQRVAVVQRRDPLLVTTKGADRVLAQAFPVPPGGTIKFKLGITAPLDLTGDGKAKLTLPAILDRNMTISDQAIHNVWIESRQAMTTSHPDIGTSHVQTNLYRVAGGLSERALSERRQSITLDRNPDAGRRVARIDDGERVVQELTSGGPPRTLMLVIDGSASVAGSHARLVTALNAIPPGVKVGAIIAAEPTRSVPMAPWSEAQHDAVVKLVRSTSFSGGQDNAPALAEALRVLEAEPQATLLWVHGPQPVSFNGSAALLEQATTRLARLPAVVLYGVEPGPNELLPDSAWAWGARMLPQTGAVQTDLADFFTRTFRREQSTIVRHALDHPADGVAAGSDQIARLWANDRVLELMRNGGNRAEAVALAARYHLVTPVSGAVVLETQQQYDESRLRPVGQGTVPTVPEPHEWALIIIACIALMWLVWRRRHLVFARAGGGNAAVA
jgi:hypothetical protein